MRNQPVKPREQMQNMSDDERKAFHDTRKAKWKGMSKEEKLQKIEKKRTERLKNMDKKWQGMSDDDKIKHVEGKMKNKKPRHGKRKGRANQMRLHRMVMNKQ